MRKVLHKYFTVGEGVTYVWRPNVIGEAGSVISTTINGAFSRGTEWKQLGGTGTGIAYLSFNASNSNSIYTADGKVYPLSLALNFIIKA